MRLLLPTVLMTVTTMMAGCTAIPVVLTDQDRAAEAAADLAAIFEPQERLHAPLTLEQAYARALAYNLDQRVKLMEEAVARDDLDLTRIEMLPKVMANAGYTSRSNIEASSSRSVLTGRQSLEPSTSTDQDRRSADLTLSWNVLDFGVSYVSARQQANRTLVAHEQRRRVIHNLFQDVRRAYWRAASAQRVAGEIRAAIHAAEGALRSSRSAESERLRSPADALRYQRAMLELIRQLEATERVLSSSKIELAALINLPPGRSFTLAAPRGMGVPRLRMSVRRMEEMALLHNADIREASYQVRVSADESRKILLRMLPGLNLSYGPQYDSNSFLVNNNWVGFAARASGNLVNLITLPVQMRRADNAEALALARRQAISVAVLAKLHIAYQQYLTASRAYRRSAEEADVDRRLYRLIATREQATAQSEMELVSARVNSVSSELRRYQAYADAQAALGRIYATLGLDPVPDEAVSLEIGELGRLIRRHASDWRGGDIPTLPEPVVAQGKPETVVASAPAEAAVVVAEATAPADVTAPAEPASPPSPLAAQTAVVVTASEDAATTETLALP